MSKLVLEYQVTPFRNTKLPVTVNYKDGEGKMPVERNPMCSVRKITVVREINTHVLFNHNGESDILSQYCHTLVVWLCSHVIGSEVSKLERCSTPNS